ncbi:MAG: hypothetical protein VB039_10000 [Oscillospiraceae bacterium]|nr:hypothetical protein [Oscillospiraceae bacterium]
MKSMELAADTPMVFVLEMFPQTFPAFEQIGVCCVSDENMNATIGQMCQGGGADTESFIAALEQIISR